MDLARLYEETEKRLSRIDISKLWKGFKPFRFALYTDRECYYDGRYIEKPTFFARTLQYPLKENRSQYGMFQRSPKIWMHFVLL